MRNCFLSVFVCLTFIQCAGANIKIKVKEDLSGEFLIYEKRIKSQNNLVNMGTGLVPKSDAELIIRERSYEFQNIYKILPKGLRFYRYQEELEKEHTFVVLIDTSSESPLLSDLNLDERGLQAILLEAKKRDDLLRFNALVNHLQLEIFLPYQIKSVHFRETRTPGDWTARSDGNGKVVINIPIDAMRANEHRYTEVYVKFNP
ncbi:putative lipoprotein [Leptospira ryugenii]|uniref:Putative lipoprotein n=1 Tax=Leptospira ryugenii TaxID=1917863 RepID=A0A2P2DVG5_9LEPT|nr:hypothetical protein [Leptospira ryugenii]GBF48614.1 putative lipoprotein [Leptospira ryugenii]